MIISFTVFFIQLYDRNKKTYSLFSSMIGIKGRIIFTAINSVDNTLVCGMIFDHAKYITMHVAQGNISAELLENLEELFVYY